MFLISSAGLRVFQPPVGLPRGHQVGRVRGATAWCLKRTGGRGIPVRVKKAVTEGFLQLGQAERVFIFLYTLLLVCYDSCCYLYRRIVFHFAVSLIFLFGRAPCAGDRNPLGLLRNLASWPPPRKRIRVRTTHGAPLVIYTRTTLPYFERMSNQVCQGVGPSNLIVHPQHTHRTQVLHDYHCALRRNMFFCAKYECKLKD